MRTLDFNLGLVAFRRELSLSSLDDFNPLLTMSVQMGPIVMRCVEHAMLIVTCEALEENLSA